MSSLTATVVLGNRHFFDGDINPLDQIDLYEGSTIAFHIRSFSEGVPTRAWMLSLIHISEPTRPY